MLRVCNPDLISLGSQNRGYKPAKCQKAHLALIHSHKRQSGNYVLKLTPMDRACETQPTK